MNQFREWRGACQRCYKPAKMHTMSMFDVALICMECSEHEKNHPKYPHAIKAERQAIERGDMNFPGVGYEEPK